jgi:hypothetical protein
LKMADISGVTFGTNQSIAINGPQDGPIRRAFPGLPEKESQNSGVSVEISNLGKALSGMGNGSLSEAELKQVKELQARDKEVRSHEQAHLAAGGGLVRGGASYQFKAGPDGHLYAVAGEVTIDTSPIPNDPDATIRKAEQIKRAAVAPADPSGQDRAVASAADSMEAKARQQKADKKSDSGSAALTMGQAMPFAGSGSLQSSPQPLSKAIF